MIGFYDDENHTNALPPWATLTEVSTALGISRDAVRSVARRALKQRKRWIKKENGKMLIDTQAEAYKSHVSRWLGQRDLDLLSLTGRTCFADPAHSQERVITPYQYYPSLMAEGYHDWPEFCQWLGTQGLNVFFNMLAGEQEISLQWQWGELHGGYHYATIKEVVIDALSCKLLNVRLATEQLPALPESQLSLPKKRALHLWPFGKKRRSRTP